MIEEGVQHKNKLIEEAKAVAEQKANALVEQAEKQAASITAQAEEKAQHLEKELKDGFVDGVKQTAHMVVKKLFNEDKQLKDDYVAGLVKEFVK